MAQKTELEIVIGADGTVRIETRGLRGTACLTETEALEKALGKVLKREKTSEYYATGAAKTEVRNR
jgi:hypothetical protein